MEEKVEVKKSGLGTASLVLGIVGMALSFIPAVNVVSFILATLALIFGIISLAKRASKGKAITGIILSVLATLTAIIMNVIVVQGVVKGVGKALDEAGKELENMAGGNTENVLKNDVEVTLGNFIATTDEYGFNDTKLTVTVKNISNERKSYSIHIEAVNANGERIDEDYVFANDLSAGQTQSFDIFTFVSSDDIEAMKAATFQIVEASAY